MALRIKNVDLTSDVAFKGRILVVAHNDIIGLGSSAALNLLAKNLSYDSMVQVDVDAKTEMTDSLITRSINSIDNLSLNMFNEVYIVGRATCSEEMLRKLFKMGVDRVVHIDNHPKNVPASVELHRDFDLYEYYTSEKYSAMWMTYNYVVNRIPELDNDYFRGIAAILDGWSTFKWTKSCSELSDPLGLKFLFDNYEIDEDSIYAGDIRLVPFDTAAINLSYVSKFEESEDFFKLLGEVMETGTGLKKYDVVIEKYNRMQDRTLKYIQYAFNDTSKGRDTKSKLYDVVVPQEDDPNRLVKVLYVDKPLDYEVASVASHYFLMNNPDMIVIYKTRDLASTFSVRSIGDLDISPFLTMVGGGGSHMNAGGFSIHEAERVIEIGRNVVVTTLNKILG